MSEDYAARPFAAELWVVFVAGVLHVVFELVAGRGVSYAYNGVAAMSFGGYVVWRLLKSPEAARAWGLRLDNLGRALPVHLGFGLLAAAVVLAGGWVADSVTAPTPVLVAGYFLWALAQQFALQNMLVKNLANLPSGVAAATAAALFGAVHLPRWPLALLCFAGGFGFTLVYRRFSNLYAVALAHGLAGTAAICVLYAEGLSLSSST